MAELTWGSDDPKRYVYGVDRGVLHGQESGLIVPWNGLTNISESEDGLSETVSVFDGNEYVALTHRSFYEAEVSAFSFPDSMKSVNGEVDALPGFILTGQTREVVDFSYRTFENEIDYKIHFVWNAIFSLKAKPRDTISEDLEALEFKWKVVATPPTAMTWDRTAHMVVDSATTDPVVLTTVENSLYGTSVSSPGFPTQLNLVAEFL